MKTTWGELIPPSWAKVFILICLFLAGCTSNPGYQRFADTVVLVSPMEISAIVE
jgi:hypothetical protein